MTTTVNAIEPIVSCLRSCLAYGRMLVEDIPADRFAHVPYPGMNHPAFCIGHLSLYPDNALELIGRSDLVARRDDFVELFAAGVDCVDDPERYPAKDEIVTHYVERHEAIAQALESVEESLLATENPAEGRFKAMCPTVGSALNFLLTAHPMVHLGQLSAWRRAMGMGGVL